MITIYSEIPMGEITFATNGDSYASALSGMISEPTPTKLGNDVIVSFETGTTSFSIPLTAQVRLNSISVTFLGE